MSSFRSGRPNRMTLAMPSAFAPSTSFTVSSTERLNTPGIDATSRRTPSPSHTNSGSMNISGDSRVSRTIARSASDRRSRRSRRVSFSAEWVWMGFISDTFFLNLEMLDDRINQRWDRVLLGHDRRLDVRLRGGLGGHRADRGDHGGLQQVGGRLGAEHPDEVADR